LVFQCSFQRNKMQGVSPSGDGWITPYDATTYQKSVSTKGIAPLIQMSFSILLMSNRFVSRISYRVFR